MDKISFWILILFLAYFVGWLGWSSWKKLQERHKQYQQADEPVAEPVLTVVGATVTAKTMADEVTGNPKLPKRNHVFTIVFTTDDGEEKAVEVPQEVFETLNEGDSGALALHDQTYYDFLKGESVAEQPQEEVQEAVQEEAQEQAEVTQNQE